MEEEQNKLKEWEELLELYKKHSDGSLPIPLRRPQLEKKTRFFIDNEFLEKGYSAKFKKYRVLDVYSVLCRRARADTQVGYPPYRDIMKMTGITNRNRLSLALQILEALDIIFTQHSTGMNANRYLLIRSELWKPANSITIDTVGKQKYKVSIKKDKTVSSRQEDGNSGDTRNHIEVIKI
ncbi:MAG: hypothetical protein UU67_C0018G0010 [Candidatus Daviesbacteria bacterium GW2011_GWB1_41_5]|uniref:Uncharacterized protein n=1 Tax=Candidatus Daviesbacteria bacterium GW2011_GWB1_41_5 TaxID=1618429 RepID=A0A0G0ZLA8_9BACT|nr:MAG: hypothetical protein UU67_C0018G0010 [Candidatus Daviesbacteria bacterium GW2011_GWB1_41_5]